MFDVSEPLAVMESLHDAIDAIGGHDPETLTDTELHHLAIGLMTEGARLAAARAAVIAAWERRGAWAADGSLRPAHRLARETRCALGTARREMARARQFDRMPATAAAVAAGTVSLDQARLLGAADQPARHDAFTCDEALLIAQCSQLAFDASRRLIDYWCQRVDADGVEADAQRQHDLAALHVSTTFQGCVAVDGMLDPVRGAIFQRELMRLERQLRERDRRDGVVRSAGQRRVDALVAMAERSATTTRGAKRARVLLSVHVGDDTLARLCELGTGRVIAPGQLLPHLDRTDLEVILFDGPATVVSVSKRRCFAGAVRRAVQARDRHCQHPSGCPTPAEECDVDHVVPHHLGGPTSQFNGQLQCPPHNRLPHLHRTGTPLPHRDITVLDHIRARLRWQLLHAQRAGPADGSDDDGDDGGDGGDGDPDCGK